MTTSNKPSKALNIILWIGQGLIALMFIWGAFAKLVQPLEETAKMMPWVAESPNLALSSGIIDLLIGLGIVLPTALRILPKLTTFAALGMIVHMIGAIVFHVSRGEASLIGMNIFLILIGGFIAWGRTKKVPILAK
uniref:DoxX family protein n=1 Tax=Roseivirga sp. TaxID=1964215 RepID=UPI004047C424